jgi:type I restriction enzyme, S subunit
VKVFPKGTLLIALYGATIGKLARLGIDAATNQAVCGIFEHEEHEHQYLYWYLFYKRRELIEAGIGGAQPNISQTILKNLEIPLPSKEVQQRIVSKIEELFSEIDKGVEEIKTAQQQLSVYKKSIIMDAVTGKLTSDWRERNSNLPTSKTVYEQLQGVLDIAHKAATEDAVLKGKRKPKDQRKNKRTTNVETDLPELPKAWNYYRLEDVTYLVTDGTHFTPK